MVNIRITGPNGEKLVEKLGLPVQERYDIAEVTPADRMLEIDYLSAGQLVGETEIDLDMADGGEAVVIAGNPLGPHDMVANDQGWGLRSNKAPVLLKGVGFDYTRLDQKQPGQWFKYIDPMIANLGANAIRTYGLPWSDGGASTPGSPAYQAQDLRELLAFAARHGIYVLIGIYVDGSATDARISAFANLIQADPNFANVLGWCVGNEVGQNFFPQIERLTKLLKSGMKKAPQVRPVSSAFPAVSAGFVKTIQKAMPSLDVLGVNSFYGCFDNAHCGGGYLNTQADSLVSGGWKKPWMITEYYSYDLQAPDMPYQVLNGGNKYMLELNSTLNAENYRESYANYAAGPAARKKGSIGGFMLNWGPPHNSKLVASWLEPLTYTGAFTPFVNPPWNNGADAYLRLEAADVIAAAYGGNLGAPCPQIVVDPTDKDPQGISCDFKATLRSPGKKLRAGQTGVTASVMASSGNLSFAWYLIGGKSADGFSGNIAGPGTNPQAYQQPTSLLLGSGTSANAGGGKTRNTITFTVPNASGNNYQLRVIVRQTGSDGAATAVVGFGVQ
jgi:hypothetical protein